MMLTLFLALARAEIAVKAEPTPVAIAYIGINKDFSMPFLSYHNPLSNPTIDGGIMKDETLVLCNELKVKPVWILLPKNRLAGALINGDVDLVCHNNEAWLPAIKDQVQWTHDLYPSRNVIVALKSSHKVVRRPEDFQGEIMGTLENFIYVGLEDSFTQKRLLRDDSPNTENSVQKLLHKRVPFIVVADLEYDFYKSRYPEIEKMDYVLPSISLKCAISKKSNLNLRTVNTIIDKLHQNGQIGKILTSYQKP